MIFLEEIQTYPAPEVQPFNITMIGPVLIQFGTAAFSIVWCLVLIKLAVNTLKARALYGNEEVWTSKPGLGVVLALLSSIVAFLGTLMGLREKNE